MASSLGASSGLARRMHFLIFRHMGATSFYCEPSPAYSNEAEFATQEVTHSEPHSALQWRKLQSLSQLCQCALFYVHVTTVNDPL